MEPPLRPDELRAQVVQRLSVCAESAQAPDLLADAERALVAAHASEVLRKAFWMGLSQDLDLLAREAESPHSGATALRRAVITTARAVAARALRLLSDPSV